VHAKCHDFSLHSCVDLCESIQLLGENLMACKKKAVRVLKSLILLF
jgi:hypothetical protein